MDRKNRQRPLYYKKVVKSVPVYASVSTTCMCIALVEEHKDAVYPRCVHTAQVCWRDVSTLLLRVLGLVLTHSSIVSALCYTSFLCSPPRVTQHLCASHYCVKISSCVFPLCYIFVLCFCLCYTLFLCRSLLCRHNIFVFLECAYTQISGEFWPSKKSWFLCSYGGVHKIFV